MSTTINTTNPAANLPPTTSSTATATPALTQNDFLKIMVAQFTQQDPLSGDSSGGSGSGTSDYVNQLMSMTNLTTMQTMSGQMTTSTQQQAMELAQSLPGASVEISNNGATVQGEVQRARLDGAGGVFLTVGGQEYSSANLISVDQTAAQAAAAAAAAAATAAATPVTPAATN